MHTLSTAAIAAIMCPCANVFAQNAVFNVPADYPTIQSAIDAAHDGDSVLVGSGSYNEAIDFLGKEIVVESVKGSANTSIDGSGLSVSIVTCTSGETAESVLRGFTLLDGRSGTNDSSPPTFVGGGMYINGANPTLEDIIFQRCESSYGGGLYAIRSGSSITDCTFNRCIAKSNSGAAQVFFNNLDTDTGVTFTNCTFTENYSVLYGGAIHAIQGDHSLVDCTFTGNGGPWWDPISRADHGGAIAWWAGNGSVLTISGCTIEGNRAKLEGGGLWVRPGYDTVAISNTTICNNTPQNVEGRYTDLGGNTVCDCIADFNGNGAVDGGDLSVLLGYWGPCLDVDCAADLNFDGVINGIDLSILLGKWGTCSF